MCMEYVDVLESLLRSEELPVPFLRMEVADRKRFNFFDTTASFSYAIAAFSITHTPGLLVIHDAWVNDAYRGKGLGFALAKARVEAYQKLLAMETCAQDNLDMVARVAARNTKEQNILEDLGWIRLNTTLWTLPKGISGAY